MKIKTITIEGTTYAELRDDKPIYVADDGQEVAFDAPGAMAKISSVQGEAMGHRRAKEEAEAKLRAFEGIADPAAALDALNKIKNLDDKKLVDAGEVQRVKDEVAKGYEGKLSEADQRYSDLQNRFHSTMIANQFATSKFIAEKVGIPADMLQASFGKHFAVDDNGRVIAKDANGNPIGSKANFGDPASFEEAIEQFVMNYPHKDSILKGTVGAGGGASNGQGSSGKATYSRAQFNALSPVEQARVGKEAGEGKVEITD